MTTIRQLVTAPRDISRTAPRASLMNPERPDVYGHDVCIDCGETTPRRLPERFPHICTLCLFEPPEQRRLDPLVPWSDLLGRLHEAARIKIVFFKPFGEELKGKRWKGKQ